MDGIWVRIKRFNDYLGRADQKHHLWFRCSNRILEDEDFYAFSPVDFLVWIYILSLGSQKKSEDVFIHFEGAERKARLKRKDILSAIEKLQGKQLDQVTSQDLGATNKQTNNTPDPSGSCTDRVCDPLPPIGQAWNEITKKNPKIKDWGKARASRGAKILEDFGEEKFRTACQKVEASEFLSGRNGKWERGATFDWLTEHGNLVKVLEGNYDSKPSPMKVVL